MGPPPLLVVLLPYIVSKMANDTFKALAHPLRRDIVERLSGGMSTVGEVSRDEGVVVRTGRDNEVVRTHE